MTPRNTAWGMWTHVSGLGNALIDLLKAKHSKRCLSTPAGACLSATEAHSPSELQKLIAAQSLVYKRNIVYKSQHKSNSVSIICWSLNNQNPYVCCSVNWQYPGMRHRYLGHCDGSNQTSHPTETMLYRSRLVWNAWNIARGKLIKGHLGSGGKEVTANGRRISFDDEGVLRSSLGLWLCSSVNMLKSLGGMWYA